MIFSLEFFIISIRLGCGNDGTRMIESRTENKLEKKALSPFFLHSECQWIQIFLESYNNAEELSNISILFVLQNPDIIGTVEHHR